MNKCPSINEKMKQLLKELVEILEFIPPQTFHHNLSYLKGITKEKFEKAIKIINDMPPFRKKRPYDPKGYQDIFGSWFSALEAAGVIEKGVINTGRRKNYR